MDLREALHIVAGDSAAGTLRVAHRLDRSRLLINEDPISVGPAVATEDVALWCKTHEQFVVEVYTDWPEFSFDHYSENGLLSNVQRLSDVADKIVWAGMGLPDQFSLAWVTFLFRCFGFDSSALHVVQFEHLQSGQAVLGIGELSAERMREYSPSPTRLITDDIAEYQKAWTVYTSNDPADLLSYLNTPARIPVLHRAMQRLVYRYPEKRSGISDCDEQILKYTLEKGPRAAQIVGYTMGFNQSEDCFGDSYLFARLRKLSRDELKSPLLTLSGDPTNMRTCEARLTEFGRDVLFKRANATERNGIDDWIGGVHLHGSRPFAHREGEKLVVGR
jgi:hypothetical protein